MLTYFFSLTEKVSVDIEEDVRVELKPSWYLILKHEAPNLGIREYLFCETSYQEQ